MPRFECKKCGTIYQEQVEKCSLCGSKEFKKIRIWNTEGVR